MRRIADIACISRAATLAHPTVVKPLRRRSSTRSGLAAGSPASGSFALKVCDVWGSLADCHGSPKPRSGLSISRRAAVTHRVRSREKGCSKCIKCY